MVQIPRGALAGLFASFRDVATVDSGGASSFVAGVDARGVLVVSGVLDALVDAVDARSVGRGAGVTGAGCTGTPRVAPAGVTFAVEAGAAAGDDVLAVALAQCDP
jgi:hypothetical protein